MKTKCLIFIGFLLSTILLSCGGKNDDSSDAQIYSKLTSLLEDGSVSKKYQVKLGELKCGNVFVLEFTNVVDTLDFKKTTRVYYGFSHHQGKAYQFYADECRDAPKYCSQKEVVALLKEIGILK